MLKDHDLRMVRIGCFSGNMETGGVTANEDGRPRITILLELDEKTMKYITCIIDEEKQTAVDIFTGECYHIIQKDSYGRIIEDKDDIKIQTYYALQVGKERVKTANQLYNFYLNYMATKAANNYNKEDNKHYQMKIINKNQN